MTTVNQGRNEIRFNNSGGKCLLENWVEERAVSEFDPKDLNAKVTSSAKILKDGHKGLLTTEFNAEPEKLTTIQDSYRPPKGPNVRQKGAKLEALERALYEQVRDLEDKLGITMCDIARENMWNYRKEVHEQFNPPPEPVEYDSVTHADFNIEGFESKKLEPTAHHDYVSEQPATFWTEHREKIHGVTQVKTGDTIFRKNAAFSTPIEEAYDEPKPYEMENVPMM